MLAVHVLSAISLLLAMHSKNYLNCDKKLIVFSCSNKIRQLALCLCTVKKELNPRSTANQKCYNYKQNFRHFLEKMRSFCFGLWHPCRPGKKLGVDKNQSKHAVVSKRVSNTIGSNTK